MKIKINAIKDKYNILYETIQNLKYRIKKTEQNQKKNNTVLSCFYTPSQILQKAKLT